MKFRFSLDPDGELDGNDPSQEHFTGHRLTSVARELAQNTNDARSEDAKHHGVPAVVSFEKIWVPGEEIPDLEGLKEKLTGCLNYAKKQLRNEDFSKFYERALELVSKKRIPVLRVCDWNTIGLEGPFKGANPVIAFAKGTGISNKPTSSSAGSRGIGKNAIFTVSDVKTAFFSTLARNRDTGNNEYLSQGKAVLISDECEGKIRRGTGYCGPENAQAMVGEDGLPEWLRRSSHVPADAKDMRGLSLFALGFNQGTDWNLQLAASALTTFFSAIQQKILEFRIRDGDHNIVIDSKNYFGLFSDENLLNALDREGKYNFERAKCYAEILRDAEQAEPEVIVEHFENSKQGQFRVCIRVAEGLPKSVALIRSGMLITEAMPGLQRFSGKDFAAVLQARTEKGMEFLRSLEGAEHNALEPDRIDDKEERLRSQKTLREITARTREIISKYIRIEVEDTNELDELAKYFPFELGDGREDPEKKELNPTGRLLLIPKKTRKPSATSKEHDAGDEVGGGGTGGGNGGTGSGGGASGEGDQPGGGDSPVRKRTPVAISNIRAPFDPAEPNARKLSFVPLESGSFNLQLFIAGSDEDEPIRIARSNLGSVSDGRLRVQSAKAGERLIGEVELESAFVGALKLFAFREESEGGEAVAQ